MTVKEIVDILNNEAKLAFERGDHSVLLKDIVHKDALKTLSFLESKQSFGMSGIDSFSSPMPNGGTKSITTYKLNKRQSIALLLLVCNMVKIQSVLTTHIKPNFYSIEIPLKNF